MSATSQPKPDYYEVLQVSPNADPEVIQAAYRRLMAKWHPDRQPGNSFATERTMLLNEAFEVLSDPIKRNDYNRRREQLNVGNKGQDSIMQALVESHTTNRSFFRWPYRHAVVFSIFALLMVGYLLFRNEVHHLLSAKESNKNDSYVNNIRAYSKPTSDYYSPYKQTSADDSKIRRYSDVDFNKRLEEYRAHFYDNDERQASNDKRVKEIAKAIEALDEAIGSMYEKEWQSFTNNYRLGKMPHEYYRDAFFQLLVKMEADDRSRCKGMESRAAALGLTVEEYCARNSYPPPQDHKAGNWKLLRDRLLELEYK